MQDEFSGQRLPDLPVAGYATTREKALTDELQFFIRGCERNRRLMLSIVFEGREKFRQIGRKAWSHLRVDTDLCDAVYACLVATAFPTYALAHGDRRDWDHGEIRRMAYHHLSALDAYEAQTMPERVFNLNESWLRHLHDTKGRA